MMRLGFADLSFLYNLRRPKGAVRPPSLTCLTYYVLLLTEQMGVDSAMLFLREWRFAPMRLECCIKTTVPGAVGN